MKSKKAILFFSLMFLVIIVTSCAPNNEMYVSELAGFWAGLWHGLICGVTFIISLFTDTVRMYEVNNNGAWYDFGFLFGAMIVLGQSGLWCKKGKKSRAKCKEKEWEEIGIKVEEKVKAGIRSWVEESEKEDGEWEEIGNKVEEKIKRELKKWTEK